MNIPEGFDLKTYGSQLAAARVAQGLSREALSGELFLPSGLLRALEEGDFGNLPEEVYVVSMYRKVATFLGVDPAPMLDKLKACSEEQNQRQAEQTQKTPVRPGPPTPAITSKAVRSNTSRRTTDDRRTGTDQAIVLLGVLVGLAAVAFFVIRWLEGRRPQPPGNEGSYESSLLLEQPVTPQIVVDEAAIEPPPPAELLPDAPASEAPLADGTVRFIINGESWFSVRNAQGELLYEDIPEPFSRLDFEAASGLAVKAGRPDLVLWLKAGGELQPLGDISAVDWITIATAQPLAAPPAAAQPAEAVAPAQPVAADAEVPEAAPPA